MRKIVWFFFSAKPCQSPSGLTLTHSHISFSSSCAISISHHNSLSNQAMQHKCCQTTSALPPLVNYNITATCPLRQPLQLDPSFPLRLSAETMILYLLLHLYCYSFLLLFLLALKLLTSYTTSLHLYIRANYILLLWRVRDVHCFRSITQQLHNPSISLSLHQLTSHFLFTL